MVSLTLAVAPEVHDCWNRIGVQGDKSCPRLIEHIHCRNCPVYAATAQAMLDRDLPLDYRAGWARHFAETRSDAAGDLASVLVFRIGAEWLALPTVVVDEVASQRIVHGLPQRRNGVVLGLANVRGELLVCVSLGQVLGTQPGASPGNEGLASRAQRRLLVLRRGTSRFAAPVDEVYGTWRYDEHELVPAPSTVAKAKGAFTPRVLPWSEGVLGCLNDQLLFQALEQRLA
jgi:chemotaxis-related protein WspD